MNQKKNFYVVTIIMVGVLCLNIISCSSDKEEDVVIDTTPIMLYSGNDKTIQGAETITSSNEFVAYSKGNVIHGDHVGEASLLVNGKYTISVNVLPKYTLYNDPICEWGCSKDYVKQRQKQGTLIKSDEKNLGYENAGAATLLAYQFENGKLKSVAAIVSTTYASRYTDYLLERFMIVPYYEGENTYFVGIDGINVESSKTFVVMQVYNISYLATLYVPISEYNNRTRSMAYNNLEEEFASVKKYLQ